VLKEIAGVDAEELRGYGEEGFGVATGVGVVGAGAGVGVVTGTGTGAGRCGVEDAIVVCFGEVIVGVVGTLGDVVVGSVGKGETEVIFAEGVVGVAVAVAVAGCAVVFVNFDNAEPEEAAEEEMSCTFGFANVVGIEPAVGARGRVGVEVDEEEEVTTAEVLEEETIVGVIAGTA